MNGSREDEDDYLDQLSQILPWQRSFTSFEQLLIVIIVSLFVTSVGCILLCLICSQSPLRQRYSRRKKYEERVIIPSAPRKDWFICSPPPPQYESIFKANSMSTLDQLNKSRYLDLARNFSYPTKSDSDSAYSNHIIDYPFRSLLVNDIGNSLTSSLTSLSPPFTQIHVELTIDTEKNTLIIHLKNGEQIPLHPAFDEQAEYFIHIQLLNNTIYKKFQEIRKKHRSNLSIDTWKNLQEKTTNKFSRTSDQTCQCDENLEFDITKTDLSSTSLRFLLFSIDRSGIEDLLVESLIPLNLSMIPKYEDIVQFKDFPQITFAELHLGISYLPTAERFTIRINKLRYLCRIDADQQIDARLTVTYFHQGRRFYQKRFPPILIDPCNLTEINQILIQNIPSNDLSSIYIHFELILHLIDLKTESILSCGSILLGQQTRYKTVWQNILDYPRKSHFQWYQFYG